MNLKSGLNTVVGLGILVSFFSCQSKGTPAAHTSIPEVSVQTITAGDGVLKNTYSASVEGVTNVEVRPQTSGYLSKIFVDEGAYVQAGQSLFKIDDRPFIEQYKTAKAAVNVALANLKNLKIDLDRKVELVDNNIVSDLQVSQATATYEASLANLEQAKATMNAAKINVDFCLVKAPVSGYIGRIPYRLGSLVSSSSVEPLTLLTDINQVFVYFSMSEGDFANFQAIGNNKLDKDSVDLILSNGKKYNQKGILDAITGQFDKNTGSISIRAKFSNPNRELRAGNTGRVEITKPLINTLLVPIKATVAVQDKIYVYKLDKDNKTQQVELEVTGKTTENYYVSTGVQQGDRIIVGGLGFVKPDIVVKPKQ
ncbi:efflux RND transporter periplasmic adaptor subunit [Sphingobacterium faecium]